LKHGPKGTKSHPKRPSLAVVKNVIIIPDFLFSGKKWREKGQNRIESS
jgi:hypothetical protein